MAKTRTADFLVEVGTEELPPGALRKLMLAFAAGLEQGLTDKRLEHGNIKPYASPRRIAAFVAGLALTQESRELEAKGPPVSIAFDEGGTPTPAALAFAKKCNVAVTDLGRSKTDKGEWLSFRSTEKGLPAAALLPDIVEQVLLTLPIPRRMRWGVSELAFVRPVHWVVLLHGKTPVPGTVMGNKAGSTSRGHRFLSTGEIAISEPGQYERILENEGFVLADFDRRQQKITKDVAESAKNAGGSALASENLYEEVAALTEWPVVMTGHFDKAFLELPREAIVASLTGHQRYFPIADDRGDLLPAFVFVANLDSTQPDKVREGNERVLRPRLADAAFFWRTDKETRLEDRGSALDKVVYQKGLGSMLDKSKRIADLCAALGRDLSLAADTAIRAAGLAKCDLLSGMVGEFPELQGVMGRYYALADGEADDVATAIGEQYLPRFAGDILPGSAAGQLLALADKLDTLAGIFSLGKKPSGGKDPFALRRAALGVIRISIECGIELCLRASIDLAVRLQPVEGLAPEKIASELDEFVADRLRSFYLERPGVTAGVFDAVSNARKRPGLSLPDFDQRIDAVKAFTSMPEAESLAAANKRISNILQQSVLEPPNGGGPLEGGSPKVDTSLLAEPSEVGLNSALCLAIAAIAPMQERRDYTAILARLAELREPIDRFFDDVLVMSDDSELRRNRLALLECLREPFHSVADISCLSVSKTSR